MGMELSTARGEWSGVASPAQHGSISNGVTSHMSEAQTDTIGARPQQQTAAVQFPPGAGKHRGVQAAAEDPQAPVQGRHRRPVPAQAS